MIEHEENGELLKQNISAECDSIEYQQNTEAFHNVGSYSIKGITTPSVKWSIKHCVKQQGPIGIHCDAPKSVPDPFPSVNQSVKTFKADARCVHSLTLL